MHSSSSTTSLLITLGRLALLSPDGSEEESLRKRRRKIAVLAVLALERRPLSRDVLVEMFWGDQEETRARHSLSDALSHLRRVLGRDTISVGRSEVALVRDAPLAVDAADFAAAVQRQEYDRALEMYGGAFLDGVYVGGSPRFEHWVERHRARFHELFLTACRDQCSRLQAAGRIEECAPVAGHSGQNRSCARSRLPALNSSTSRACFESKSAVFLPDSRSIGTNSCWSTTRPTSPPPGSRFDADVTATDRVSTVTCAVVVW